MIVDKKRKSVFIKILGVALFLAFIVGAAIVIYRIPDEKISDILLTIISAIIGGALTLIGVAWTIRNGAKERERVENRREKERAEEEKKKAKPYFTFCMMQQGNYDITNKMVCFEDIETLMLRQASAIIKNSNNSVFTIEQLYHDGKWYAILANNVVLPGENMYLNFTFNDYSNIFLKIKDILGNDYYYELKLVQPPKAIVDGTLFYTIRELREISEEKIAKMIS